MNRQEQIQKAALEYASKSIQDKGIAYLEFIEAVEWADRSMIEKACQWLQDSVCDGHIEMHECNIDDFRKAMEE